MKKRKLKLPRVPLPRQKGGAHRVKTKRVGRRAKHKMAEKGEEW